MEPNEITRDLERIEHQERTLHFRDFDEETAWRLGTQIRGLGMQDRLPIVIDVRRFDRALFFAALPGSVPDNAEWVRRKNNVVARFHRSSYAMSLLLKQKSTTLADRYGLPLADYAAHGGSFPLYVQGAGVVGSAAVSGMQQRADHELVVWALCAVLGRDYSELALSDSGLPSE